MELGTILVHLDHSERCLARVGLAVRLARARGWHVVGLIPTGLRDGAIAPDAHPMRSPEFIGASADYLRLRADATAHLFKQIVRDSGQVSHEARLVDGGSADALIDHGHASDLIVVGQVDQARSDHDKTADATPRDLPGQAMLHSGRPVLVVPCAGHFEEVGRKVMVAWDGTREAAMALRDSLPLLDPAARVMLISMRNERDAPDPRRLCVPETLAWLRRHGIDAQAEERVTALCITETLRVCAAHFGADLVVMGGFGHTRFREAMLGGTTREMLARAKLPVLISH
ncbi:universal stress protein [Variovorax sp. PBL-E5]|uniref:universal stress protein n=1 Tax=Variovorax sp. PBL-E5 TaxID=434014 RepID=UPI00131900AC|nr:universal stress protein [Variovorax sp. PBL-E5]VTU21942.1 Universal stress protein family protein [Variovorax sp. PBL-E5]